MDLTKHHHLPLNFPPTPTSTPTTATHWRSHVSAHPSATPSPTLSSRPSSSRAADHAIMPDPTTTNPSAVVAVSLKPTMTNHQLVELVKKELDAEQEREKQVNPAGDGDLSNETQVQTGSTLDLSHKNISVLPAEVVLLIKDKVERLALSHNPRISLPLEIAQCDRLRYLNLRWNKLRHFPEAVLSLCKLEILDISKNSIDSIPEDIKKMTNLKFLAVARNQIKRLPLALGEMNLVKLKFDENPIEFPPADVLKPPTDRTMADSEKDKEMCQQVKRYMKTAAMREKLRSTSEEDLSTVETPRPARRVVTGGRFPVRPSISGIENIEGLKSESPPEAPPPIPQRSHARGLSSTVPPQPIQNAKRPSASPLLGSGSNSNESSRSRSETVSTSANIRNRRQGYVPRKNTNLNSFSEMSSQISARSSQAPTLTPPHSRAPSVTSTYLNVSGGESSSGAVSPIDGPVSRALLLRKLASLPESRNSIAPTIDSIKAVKRVLFMLFYLHRPLADIAQQLGSGTPRRSTLERQLFSAHAQVEELDRLIKIANNIMEDNMEVDATMIASIVRAATVALRLHVFVIKELNRHRQQAVKKVDAFHIRCVMNSAHATVSEARNVCHLLGFKTRPTDQRNTLRAEPNWNSRTVTPTQPKQPSGPRRRGATILPSSSSVTNLRGMAPPVPLHANSSRSNTMTSMSAATPRWNQSFTDLASQNHQPSRSNTMRSTAEEADDTADRIYLKLKGCCDLASSILPPVRQELKARKAREERSGHTRLGSMYGQAIQRCDLAIATNNKLLTRLKVMRVGDPARYQHEFKQMAESFTKDWAHFAEEIMKISRDGLDIGNIKHHLKPLQAAVREVTRVTQSLASTPAPLSANNAKPAPLHPGFSHALNASLAQHAQQQTYLPPVPATPLSAALGPAVQATVPPTPTTAFNSPILDAMPQMQPMAGPPSLARSATLPPPGFLRGR